MQKNDSGESCAANDAMPPMEQWQRAAVSAWVKSLGGSDTEVAEEIGETIQQCETDLQARRYYLGRATEIKAVLEVKQEIQALLDIAPETKAAVANNTNPYQTDTLRYCHQCAHSIPAGLQVARCSLSNKKLLDHAPKLCDEFKA